MEKKEQKIRKLKEEVKIYKRVKSLQIINAWYNLKDK